MTRRGYFREVASKREEKFMAHRNYFAPIVTLFFSVSLCWASDLAAQSVTIEGELVKGRGYTVYFVEKSGKSTSAAVGGNGRFSITKITKARLQGASLQVSDSEGRYAGPVVLGGSGSKVSTTFSGKLTNAKQRKVSLGKITVRAGYAELARATASSLGVVVSRPTIRAVRGKPVGAGQLGLVRSRSTRSLASLVTQASISPGGDDDRDGIPSAFDADDDGDLVLDASDPDSAGSDIPYTTMVLDFRNSLNAHVRAGLSNTAIDAVIGGENVFALATFISLPQSQSAVATGGYIVCDDALAYCRRNSPVAYFSGVSESSNDFRRPWAEILTSSGYPRMEKINSLGAVVAAIQPRVGRSQFRPGDVYEAVVTSGAGEITRKTFTLAPYFVSVPALKSYDAGAGEVEVDYSSVSTTSGSIPGTSPSDPIVLPSSGELTMTFWRPQRAAIRSDESGFLDWGSLNYGVGVGEIQATCAGLYTNVSSGLIEDTTPFGNGDSVFFNQGANGAPYRDSVGDRAAAASNTLTFTVDLKTCATRGGGTGTGTAVVSLEARGENVTGGQTTARQSFYVQFQ
jgi:hypothetical protein